MKDGFESLGRVRTQGVLLLALAFGAGLAGGMALERVRATREFRAAARARAEMRRPGGPMEAFRELDLTAEQREGIRTILEASRPLVDSVFGSTMPRMSAIHDSVRAEIRALLTPEQQERFDAMAPRWERRGPMPGRPGMRRGPPPPPDFH